MTKWEEVQCPVCGKAIGQHGSIDAEFIKKFKDDIYRPGDDVIPVKLGTEQMELREELEEFLRTQHPTGK